MSAADRDPSPKEPPQDWRRSLVETGPYIGLGMQLAGTMVFFTGAGYLLDRWLEMLPWFTITGALVGMVVLFIQLVRVAGQMTRDAERRKRHRNQDEK